MSHYDEDLDIDETVAVSEDDEGYDTSSEGSGSISYDTDEPEQLPREALNSTLNLSDEAFDLTIKEIKVLDIAPALALSESRKDTHLGLSQSVKELGVLTPIHVMLTEGFKDFLAEGNDEADWVPEEDGSKYILMDGFRRVWAAVRNKIEYINAVIFDFKDTDTATDLLVPLSLLINKSQRRNWNETWGLFEILETISMMTPSTLEYLLQLEAGDAMKLKDIMLSGYDDIIADLVSDKKNLETCYRALQKARKEEDTLGKEDGKGLSDIDGSDEIIGDRTEGDEQRTVEEVKNILDFGIEDLDSLSDDDFEGLAGDAGEGIEIDRRKGEDIPKELKLACLARDNYTCQVSGYGLDRKMPMLLTGSVLHVHHIIPLYLGGKNTLDNLVTIKMDHHTLVHVIERLGGKIGMTREDFDQLEEGDRVILLKVLGLAKLIVDEAKRQGVSLADRKLQEASRRASQFKMPGTDLKENLGV